MFGKKKQPYPQEVIEEYSDEESEPLIEEVDNNYEPTEKQVREYGLDVLGMNLPEDQNLLYLAREGLKAPIPQNWVPYQSRTGQIYYKHKITQEKIYEHPTDIQYRKLYTQQKQKMTRKNLKSIALKQNIMQSQIYGGQNLPGSNPLMPNLSNLSGNQSQQIQPTIDHNLLDEWQQEVAELQKKEEREWKQFEEEEEHKYQIQVKKYYEEYLEEKEQIKNPEKSKGNKTASKILENEKEKIKKNFEASFQADMKEALRLYQKEEDNKLEEYRAVYEEDNKIKITKIQQDLNANYEQKKNMIQETVRKNKEREQKLKIERQNQLSKVKSSLEDPGNPQIKQLLSARLQQHLAQIEQQYEQKIKNKEEELTKSLQEIKKMLGVDKIQQLQQLAEKKEKIQRLSQQKIQSYKQKQLLNLNNQFEGGLEKVKKQLERSIQKQYKYKCQNMERELMSKKLLEQKEEINRYFDDKTTKRIQQYERFLDSQKNKYERQLNDRLNGLRDSHISNEMATNKNENNEVSQMTNRLLLQEKQHQIHHKEELIKMLTKELAMEQKQLNFTKLQKQIEQIVGISSESEREESLRTYFQNKFRKYHIEYQSPQYMEHLELYRKHASQYKQDKKLLARISKVLQEKSMRAYRRGNTSGSSMLIKKYNDDVRLMRDNQKMLHKFEILLKKAQITTRDNFAMKNLRDFVDAELEYQKISLKNELEEGVDRVNENIDHIDLNENNVGKMGLKHEINIDTGYVTNKSFDNTLRKHSQFLNGMKHQLNRKLYQLRYDVRY